MILVTGELAVTLTIFPIHEAIRPAPRNGCKSFSFYNSLLENVLPQNGISKCSDT